MNLFVLTPEEKRVVAFITLMILVGVSVKQYRQRHPPPSITAEVQKHPWMRKLPPLPSVAPDSAEPKSGTARPRRSRKPRNQSPSPSPEEEANQEQD